VALLAALATGVVPAASASVPDAGLVMVIVREHAGVGQGPEQQVAALGGAVTRQLRIIDGFAARLPASAVPRLRQAAGVRAVSVDAALQPLGGGGRGAKHGWDDSRDGDEHAATFDAKGDLGSLQNVAEMIGADDLHHDRITGQGVDVALVDTGVVPVEGLAGADKVVNGADLSFESQSEQLRYLDTNGHGTHMGGSSPAATPAAATSRAWPRTPGW
jgi:serine protease AprX